MANILTEIEDRTALVTVNRPDALNALNSETVNELKDVFRGIRADENVGAVILTGAGEKAFIAGADIKEMTSASPTEAIASARRGQDLTNLIEDFPRIVIAAVNGYATASAPRGKRESHRNDRRR